ncbi:MAG: hypothetical protein AAF224_08805 [Pseudomonadota bacterium]
MMKFIASDLEAAKSKARRAIGDHMVVLSVRNLPSGDVEVAASDKPEPAAPGAPPPASFGAEARRAMDDAALKASHGVHQTENGAFSPLADRSPGTGARLNEPLEQKFSETNLAKLSSTLVSRKGKSHEVDVSDETIANIVALLKPHGVDAGLLAALANGARAAGVDDDLYRLETAFSEAFSFHPVNTVAPSPIMLVGPTGAGKTSCAAKLAAAAIAAEGAAFMMTADVGRAGAIEQVQTYGRTLGADYYIVESPLDVAQAMRSKTPGGFVIFDTPGISPFDPGDFAALKSYQEAAGAEPVLVLPASGDAEEYKDWATSFAEFGVRRIILTKFDATKRVGAGLTAAFAGGMSLANFSESPFISEGLIAASPEFLARRLIANRPGRIAG